jgi:hypothetical protein
MTLRRFGAIPEIIFASMPLKFSEIHKLRAS